MDWNSIFGLSAGELIGASTAAYVLCALGLSMHFGYTGLLNFGQAAFAAIGGYGFSIAHLTLGLSLFPSVGFALLCSALFAVLLGIPTLRLRADYLAIVTIAAAQVFKFTVATSGLSWLTGGADGLAGFTDEFYALNPIPEGDINLGVVSLTNRQVWVALVGWVLVALAATLIFFLLRSPWGRVLKGIREDEDAVRALGKNVFSFKMQALILGGLMASLGGIIFVITSSTIQPATWGTNFTFMIWTVLLLGGAATILGPIVGGMIFFVLLMFTQNLLAGLVEIGWLPFLTISQVGQIRFIFIGLALMLLVIFRPQGIFGNKKETFFNV
jgi:branched-chain amino acid transport system permease protein